MTAFDRAWAIVKAELPDLDFNAEVISRPSWSPYAKQGDLDYHFTVDPHVGLELFDEFDRYNLDDDWKTTAPYNKITLPKVMREFSQKPSILSYPLNVAQRQNARHQGKPIPYSVFTSAMTDEDEGQSPVRRWLEELENEGSRASLAAAHTSPKGDVANIFLNPGFGGRGIGQHLLGSILQDTGLVGDNQFSIEGYDLWNSLGGKLTSGGDLTIHDFNKLPGMGGNEWSEYYRDKSMVDRTKGDFRFTRPTEPKVDDFGGRMFVRDPDYMSEGDEPFEYSPPTAFPHQYDRLPFYLFTDGEDHPLRGRYPLEIAYLGSDPKAVTNVGRRRIE